MTNMTPKVLMIAATLALVAGCDKAAAMQGPEAVPECAELLKVMDQCDAKTKHPGAGVEQKVMRDTWKVTVSASSVKEVAAECKTNADEKRKSCGLK